VGVNLLAGGAVGPLSERSPDQHRNQATHCIHLYSRTDINFVDRLEGALKAHGVNARVDRDDIEKGEEWWARIHHLIAEADTIIFVLKS
jgi:hypothetical protein